MNIATFRTFVRAALTTTLALGAFAFLAAPQAAQAQNFAVGVQFGQPAYSYGYVAPRPAYGYGYEAQDRFRADRFRDHEAWERRQAFLRREEWERQQAFARHEEHERHEAYEHRYNGWR